MGPKQGQEAERFHGVAVTVRNLLQNCETLLQEAMSLEPHPTARGQLSGALMLISAIHYAYEKSENYKNFVNKEKLESS